MSALPHAWVAVRLCEPRSLAQAHLDTLTHPQSLVGLFPFDFGGFGVVDYLAGVNSL
jgi:hypothetical protein